METVIKIFQTHASCMMIMVRQRFARRMGRSREEVVRVAQVTVATGQDVDYYLDQAGANYYLLAEEPPGIWTGSAAPGLGLTGEVDPGQMRALYHHNVGPDGVPLGKAQKSPQYEAKRSWQQIEDAIQARIDDLGPIFATPEKVREIRLQERAKSRTSTPYYDMTFSAEKSVSLAWAAARAAALRAVEEQRKQEAGQVAERTEAAGEAGGEQIEAGTSPLEATAGRYEALARSIEATAMTAADAMIGYIENHGAIVRTGHHSANSGEWRDAAGLIGVKFLQHTSRSNDPQLHVQAPLLNKAQRADAADEKWRSLDGRQLWALRLGAAAHAGVAEAQALARLGLPLVKRADGNGFEIGGVTQTTMDAFSRRARDIEAKLAARVAEYEEMYGRPPSRAALYKLRKRTTLETRAAKQKLARGEQVPSEEEAAAAEKRLEEWARQAEAEHAQALDTLWDDIAAYAAEHPEANPSGLPSEAERAEIIRSAVAEVQKQNAAWSRSQLLWELYRQIPVLPADTDGEQFLEELADDALANRVEDTNILQIGHVPDVVDVAPLGLRHDGTSVFRKPNENRYTTAEHLDREEWILRESKRPAPQLVTAEAAEEALAGTDLDYDQKIAARGLLTSTQLVTSLVAPAGSGKTHVMGPVSRAWMAETGCRVIGLTLSQNASHEMYKAGVAEAWNIARFFTRGVPVYRGDVLVVDEASQVSTTDLAKIMQLAMDNGARVILTGDPEQLGPVEAGGMFGLVAEESGHWKLTEIRRFNETWEGEASKVLRARDMNAWIEYGSRGLVTEGPQDRIYDQAADTWVLDAHQGASTLLLTATNEEAAKLSALVRQRRIEGGEIPAAAEVTLSDGNEVGVGDLVRARLNSQIEAGGRTLDNRDTLRIEGFLGTGTDREAVAVRRDPEAEGGWSRRFTFPAAYLEEHAELDYAGNVHVAQGRTVDRQTLVVTEGTGPRLLYVGMTRGREENRAYVVTGPPDPADWTRQERQAFLDAEFLTALELHKTEGLTAATEHLAAAWKAEPEGMRPRAPWESVIAAAMSREDLPATATETMRAAQKLPTNFRHLHDLKQAFWWKDVVPKIDGMVRERIGEREFERYMADPERPALLQELRAHEIGGRRIPDVLDAITRRDFAGAQSIAAVLHGRLGKEEAPARGHTSIWTERTPEEATPEIREVDGAAAARQAELGKELAERPPHWALEAWGVPPAEQGALRNDWMKRAAEVQQYRELAGITDPAQAIGPAPARQADLTEAFTTAVRALALPDEAALLKAMGRGDLEAKVRQYERAQATAPADVTAALESNYHAITFWASKAAEYEAAGNETRKRGAEGLQTVLQEKRDRLRVADAAHREWAEATVPGAEAAERARDELRRRRTPMPEAPDREGGKQPQRGVEPEAERVAERMAPEQWAELKAAQTARVEADRQARREAAARAVPVTDEEIARFGQAVREIAADLDGIGQALDQIHRADDVTRSRREARQAEHELHEEAIRHRSAELAREAEAGVWERGTRPAGRPPVHRDREMDGPELGI